MTISNQWQTICQQNDLINDSGICVLLNDNQQVAIFYLKSTEQTYAISNYDPIGQANVLYRGIIGSIDEDIVVASPLYKQHFSLISGECIQDKTMSVDVFETRIVDDLVQLKVT
ncbi:nitrite reductase (NAD(P)H) small subunit [Pseudoalteromonas sp. NBT06-2]|uniref:nitrite reductase small subunit NirD n=1 Tax=Pseudoalteromonas sp. NBT06-2 TaxID=2025950 RepID=UPI000BA7BF04|nr:nitrite reductase small subunit NirD [Pseudoalteromonas sp. NBT06-2]PAJ73021.1 nitrite reductase (NAD(P)H) small subunit [Pseudoalteromonas sp. NBT06-2]